MKIKPSRKISVFTVLSASTNGACKSSYFGHFESKRVEKIAVISLNLLVPKMNVFFHVTCISGKLICY